MIPGLEFLLLLLLVEIYSHTSVLMIIREMRISKLSLFLEYHRALMNFDNFTRSSTYFRDVEFSTILKLTLKLN